ncbi:MAG: T9SS type A sorting domain-containing protein [Crocinitomicaceae bacterium]|nr:T9SS type A sorting domain-containing protein [Flavobacteriales bacterium]NQZ37043.1 T9SS type A sorting domain-containing protein [Crocinitomicaceae bacterium]
MKIYLGLLFSLFALVTVAQCNIIFNSDTVYVCENVPVQFIAVTPGVTYGLDSCDFNGPLPLGWSATGSTAPFAQACQNNLDGTPYYWSSDAWLSQREVISPSLNYSCGGELSFDLRFGVQAEPFDCEGPDSEMEGVEVQYSVDNGVSWITFSYFNPTGILETTNPGTSAIFVTVPTVFTSWANYTIQTPSAAATPNTMFRWVQLNPTNVDFDNWGLDNIVIDAYPCVPNSYWSTGAVNTNTITLSSTVDTLITYAVNDQQGNLLCMDTCYLLMYPIGFDNNIQLIAQSFTAGQSSYLVVDAFNDGCPIQSGQISVVLNPQLSYNISTPAPDQIVGDTLFYNYTNLYKDGSHLVIPITVTTDAQAQLGDSINISVYIADSVGDIAPWNNEKYYIYPVLASYDPNDKKVYPTGECTPGYVANDQTLTYTIRFQNIGTAAATNVSISDQIDADLDLSTLKVVAKSHDMYVNWPGGNLLEFKFDSIYLPNQLADDFGSNGYVVFEIEQMPGLAHNTEIKNHVDIYFDFNPPITTNEVVNTVTDGSHHVVGDTLVVTSELPYMWNNQTYSMTGLYSTTLSASNACDSTVFLDLYYTNDVSEIGFENSKVYPNPTNGELTLEYGETKVEFIELCDAYGKILKMIPTDADGEVVIQLDYPSGIYFLKLKNEDTMRVFKIVKW